MSTWHFQAWSLFWSTRSPHCIQLAKPIYISRLHRSALSRTQRGDSEDEAAALHRPNVPSSQRPPTTLLTRQHNDDNQNCKQPSTPLVFRVVKPPKWVAASLSLVSLWCSSFRCFATFAGRLAETLGRAAARCRPSPAGLWIKSNMFTQYVQSDFLSSQRQNLNIWLKRKL